MEAKYNLKHAKEILEPCGLLGENQRGKYLRIKKRGVMPAIKRDLLLQTETEGLRWRPARQLQLLPGAPEVKGTPMLPNPFTARELAAFMLEGAGALVADFYGEWDDGPDPESLRAIDPDSKARRAVTEAFTAYRLAIEKVGKYDMDALARRDAAHTAYWKSSNDKALLKAFEDAEAEWDAAYQAWLTKMVRCLLEPQAAAPAPVAGIATNNATPDPERRLARLRALGGDAIYRRGEWKITGISALVGSEKGEGRKRCDEKTIRADLKEAAESEREAKRANAFSGLGQR